jgi:hypothetical protein
MSEVNIDAALVRDGGANLSRTDEALVEMTNGCICCTLRDDLLKEVRQLAEQGRFDYLLIESTGIAEPLPVATTFEFRDEDGQSLSDIAELDTMVTVVDAAGLLADYASTDFLGDRGETAGDGDNRTVIDLLVEQIEFADVVVLNKIGTATEAQRIAARQIIVGLNPDARLIEVDFGKVGCRTCSAPACSTSTRPRPIRSGTRRCTASRRPYPGDRGIRHPLLRLPREAPLRSRKAARSSSTPPGPASSAPRASSGWPPAPSCRRGQPGRRHPAHQPHGHLVVGRAARALAGRSALPQRRSRPTWIPSGATAARRSSSSAPTRWTSAGSAGISMHV